MKQEREESMTARERFAQAIREERGEMTLQQFSKRLNVSISTIDSWEKNKRVPEEKSINHLAEILGWDDDTRVSFMAVPEGIGDKQKAFIRRTQFLKVTRKQAAEALGYTDSTISYWINGREFGDELSEKIDLFMSMSVEEARKLFEEEENVKAPLERKRVTIDYPTIHRLEEKHRPKGAPVGRMAYVPDDDPELIELQRYMNAEW